MRLEHGAVVVTAMSTNLSSAPRSSAKRLLLSTLGWGSPFLAGVAIVAVTWFVIHQPI